MSHDREYYLSRRTQERKIAASVTDDRARRVHLELAARYELLAGGLIGIQSESGWSG